MYVWFFVFVWCSCTVSFFGDWLCWNWADLWRFSLSYVVLLFNFELDSMVSWVFVGGFWFVNLLWSKLKMDLLKFVVFCIEITCIKLMVLHLELDLLCYAWSLSGQLLVMPNLSHQIINLCMLVLDLESTNLFYLFQYHPCHHFYLLCRSSTQARSDFIFLVLIWTDPHVVDSKILGMHAFHFWPMLRNILLCWSFLAYC